MKVMIVATAVDRAGIARLPEALQRAGFEVGVVCPAGSAIGQTRFTDRMWILDGAFNTVQALFNAMNVASAQWVPDLVIPGDDMAVRAMHRMVEVSSPDPAARALLDVIGASLAAPARFPEIEMKSRFPDAASASAIDMPPQIVPSDIDPAIAFAEGCGWPVLVKPDYGFGGIGIVRCHTADELAPAIRQAKSSALAGPNPRVASVQKFIEGKMSGVVLTALRGEMLAALAYEKLQTVSTFGPSSVVRRLDRDDLVASAARLVRHFRFTGYGELEFLIERDTGKAWLLEFNARPAPVATRAHLMGADLAAALLAGLGGTARRTSGFRPVDDAVALFPQEWKRDPESPFLRSAYHDVPWDDPALLKHFVDGCAQQAASLPGRRQRLSIRPRQRGLVSDAKAMHRAGEAG